MAPPPGLLELKEDSLLAELVKDWKFEGLKFQAKVRRNTNKAVHHTSSSKLGSFSLLAVFRRYTFRLTEESVSIALHACLGGSPAGFHVSLIKDRHFKFEVSSKEVGFMFCDLKRVITEHFDVYFHLWRDGGANWIREKKQWNIEEEQSWTKVSYEKKQKKPNNYNDRPKTVRWCEKIVQDSPASKAVPRELGCSNIQSIRVGSFECNFQMPDECIDTEHCTGKYSSTIHGAASSQPSEDLEVEDEVPCSRVFGTLKRDLHINDRDYSYIQQSYYPPRPSAVMGASPNRACIIRPISVPHKQIC